LGAASLRALLDLALGAIRVPAFVVERDGQVHAENAAGRRWIECEGAAGRAALRREASGAADARFEARKGSAPEVANLRLVLVHTEATPGAIAQAAERWSLTPREREVVARLVDGLTTRSIAAALGCAERTVETHLTHIFAKAGVASRAELMAAVWSE
jgi:DNA-binding CsgD family transcriptional regulator